MGTVLMQYQEELRDYSCIILRGQEIIYRSKEIGVRPLLHFFEVYGQSPEPITVIDRIMGKGAVMMGILCGAKQLYTPVISEPGLWFSKIHGIQVNYDEVVPFIINRQKDGQCPIEKSLIGIEDLQVGYLRIKETLEALTLALSSNDRGLQ